MSDDKNNLSSIVKKSFANIGNVFQRPGQSFEQTMVRARERQTKKKVAFAGGQAETDQSFNVTQSYSSSDIS